VALRHGIANVLRPGNHAAPVLASMGGAMALLFSIHLLERAITAEMADNFPPNSANVFVLNVAPQQVADLERFLKPRAVDAPVLAPFYSVRVLEVDGRPIGKDTRIAESGLDRRWLAARFERRPSVVELVEGSWWPASGEPAVALPRMAARALEARVGSRILFDASGLTFTARVAAIDRIGPLDRLRCCFLFSPSTPIQAGATYQGIVGVRPGSVGTLRRELYRAFPAVTTVDATESLRLLGNWLDAVLWSARLIAALAMTAAAVLLGSTVAATRMWRVREIAILKALGARRQQLIRIYAVEFTILGCAAGAIGVLVSAAWSRLFPSAIAAGAAVGGAALLANAGGWLAAFRFIGRKPLETLRGE
jgi:putative ABC transport system permease protein